MINYIKTKIARHKAKKYVTDGPLYGPTKYDYVMFGKFPHTITLDTVNDAGLREVADIKVYLDGKEVHKVKTAYPSPYPDSIKSVVVYDTDDEGIPYLDDCEEFVLKRLKGVVTYSVSLR